MVLARERQQGQAVYANEPRPNQWTYHNNRTIEDYKEKRFS